VTANERANPDDAPAPGHARRAGGPSAATPAEPARDRLASAGPAIARRIRSLRRQDSDWSMRTSDLLGSTMRRVLQITDRGRKPLTTPSFWSMVDATVRSVVVDRIRRRAVRRRALGILRDQARSQPAESPDPQPGAASAAQDEAQLLLDALTDDECLLIRLRLGGMEWSQVADVLGIAPAAARQRWAALRRKARGIVQAADPATPDAL